MRKSKFKEPRVVLIFNRARTLVGITSSLHTAADITLGNLAALSHYCLGKASISNGLYYRYLHPDVLIELDDLGSLRIEDYDRLCGEERKYTPLREIKRHKPSITKRRLSYKQKLKELAKNSE